MKIDAASLQWFETEIEYIEYGEIGLIFTVHDGRVVKRRRIIEIKEEPLEDATGFPLTRTETEV